MKTRTFNLISFIISLIFVASLIFFAAGLITDKKNGSARAQEIFTDLTEKTNTAANLYSTDSYSFSQSFIESAGNFKDYKKLTLFVDGKLVYSYENSVHLSAKNVKDFSSKIQNKNGQNLLIEATVFTTRPYSFFFYARTTFIVILLATIAAVLILVFAKAENPTTKTQDDFLNDADKIIFEDEDIQLNDFSNPKENENDNSKETENSSIQDNFEENTEEFFEPEIQETKEETEDKNEILSTADKREETNITDRQSDIKVEEDEKSTTESNDVNESAQDFNAVFEERLLQSTQKNEDLCVLVIKNESENNSTEQIHNLFDLIFNENADIFEYKNGLFLILLSNTALDDALIPAKKLYSAITEESGNKVTIGLSARNMRKISTERLLTEASEAQKHAAEDPTSPIIAFRASPEKYNSLILNNK